MGREDLEMKEFIYFGICFAVLALTMLYRVIAGPSVADRTVAADSVEILADMVLVCYALYSGRAIYVDVAIITAIIGFIGNLIISRYLEGGMDE